MTERNLFRTALVVLGSTILVPGIVSLTGAGAPAEKSVSSIIKNHLAVANQKATTGTQNDKSDSDTQQSDNTTDTSKEGTSSSSSDKSITTAPTQKDTSKGNNAGAKASGKYTVKAGDTYGCIAENYYGSYDQWSRIYGANGGWAGYEEYSLTVGAVLQMPAVSATEALPKTDLCQ